MDIFKSLDPKNLDPNTFFKGKLSNWELILGTLIPFSQLYFRLFYLDGSLDKPWLLIPFFLVLPLSFIPTMYVHWGWIDKGEGGSPFDNWMYIPMLFHVLITLFLNKMESKFDIVLRLSLIMISIMIPYFVREYNVCKKMGLNQIANIFGNAALIMGLAQTIPPLLSTASYFPMVGTFFSIVLLIRNIPVIGESLLWSIGYLLSYVVLNILNGLDKDIYCTRNYNIFLGFIGIIVGIFGYALDLPLSDEL